MMGRRAAVGKGTTALLCSLLMVFQPVWGATAAIGTLSGGGPVALNGISAPPGTIVFAGNQIDTGPGAVAYVNLKSGGRLVLGASSSALITASDKGVSVKLDHGVVGALSEAKAPVVVTVRGVTVRALRAGGVYEVSLEGKELKVLANHGTARAEAANRTVEVPEGKVLNASVNQGSSFTTTGEIILGTLIAAGAAGLGLGLAYGTAGKSCASTSGLTCQ